MSRDALQEAAAVALRLMAEEAGAIKPAELQILVAWGLAVRELDGARWGSVEEALLDKLRAARNGTLPVWTR